VSTDLARSGSPIHAEFGLEAPTIAAAAAIQHRLHQVSDLVRRELVAFDIADQPSLAIKDRGVRSAGVALRRELPSRSHA
jgi:hypothetical protein